MKKIILLILLSPVYIWLQAVPVLVVTPNTPTGTRVSPLPVYEKTPDGILYTCQFGEWGAVGVGGSPGGITQLTGPVTAGPGDGVQASTTEFATIVVKDATTVAWGDTYVAGGANPAILFCDGSAWHVYAR